MIDVVESGSEIVLKEPRRRTRDELDFPRPQRQDSGHLVDRLRSVVA